MAFFYLLCFPSDVGMVMVTCLAVGCVGTHSHPWRHVTRCFNKEYRVYSPGPSSVVGSVIAGLPIGFSSVCGFFIVGAFSFFADIGCCALLDSFVLR